MPLCNCPFRGPQGDQQAGCEGQAGHGHDVHLVVLVPAHPPFDTLVTGMLSIQRVSSYVPSNEVAQFAFVAFSCNVSSPLSSQSLCAV